MQKSTMISPISFLIPSPKLPVTQSVFYLPTLSFQSPMTYMMSLFVGNRRNDPYLLHLLLKWERILVFM